MIQEFHLSVTPVGEDEYLVRTERVAPGVPLAEEQVLWPVEDWLTQAGQLMNDPLLTLLQGSATHQLGTEQLSSNLIQLGQKLYNVLFQGTLRDSWMTAQGIAYHRREALRLRLGLKGSRLPRLPWEVLHAGNRPIATGTDLVFSRYQPTFTPLVLPLQLQGVNVGRHQDNPSASRLKILMVLAAPTDQENLELKREVIHLQEELQQPFQNNAEGVAKTPDIQLTILDQPDREQLTQALEQGQYQVLHYAGHSNLAAAGGSLYLVSGKTGLSEVLSGDDLAGLLVNNGIRMAVFNSCRGASTATATIEDIREQTLAEALVRRGIPAVLAMAERIPDEVALTLTRLFYRNLKQGYPVDLSVSRARQGLVSTYGSHQLYWALPILYLHPEFDGYLVGPAGLGTSTATAAPSTVINTGSNLQTAFQEQPFDRLVSQLPLTTIVETSSTNQDSSETSASQTFQENPFVSRSNQLEEQEYAEEELADLVDDLEYGEDLSYESSSASVSDLIRQLSYSDLEVDLAAEEPITPASSAENLLPGALKVGSETYLNFPENPLYRKSIADLTSLYEIHLEQFNQANWQIKDFIRVRCVPFTDWQKAFAQLIISTEVVTPSAAQPNGLKDRIGFPDDSRTPTHHSGANQNLSATLVERQARLVPTSDVRLTPATQAVALNQQAHRPRNPALMWPFIGGIGATVIFLVGTWLFPATLDGLRKIFMFGQPSHSQASQSNSAKTNSTIAATAIKHFNQGTVPAGQQAVEQLLDRGALQEALSVLSAVKTTQANEPIINFLRGRLTIQFIKAGSKDHSLNDAQRYFEAAVQAEPNIPIYYNALGFVSYALGDVNRANQAWFKTLYLIEAPENTGEQNLIVKREDALIAYAGLALALVQSAENQSPQTKAALISEALKLREKIMTEKPQSFRPETLSQDWIWPEKAIADWDALLDL